MTVFSDESAKLQKQDNYFIAIEGLTEKYSLYRIQNPTSTFERRLGFPRGIEQRVYPLEGKSSLSGVSFTLLDTDGGITDLVSVQAPGAPLVNIQNRKVQVFAGYRNIDEAEYQLVFTGDFYDPPRWSMNTKTWSFAIADNKRRFREKIMTNATDASRTFLSGNVLNIYYAILTGDFANVTFPVVTSGATPTGLGIAASDVDATGIQAERDEWLYYVTLSFTFKKEIKAEEFLRKELFRIFGYPTVGADGKVGFRAFHAPHPAEAVKVIEKKNVLGNVTLAQRWDLHVNQIQILGDYDIDTDTFGTVLAQFDDTADQSATNAVRPLIIESKGLRSTLQGATIARLWLNRVKQRLIPTPNLLGANIDFTQRDLKAGQVIDFTHDEVPNSATGDLGVASRRYELTSIRPDFRQGSFRVSLLETAIGNRYRAIGPNSLPDYGSQTQAQKDKYGSIADTGTLLLGGVDPAHTIL